MTTQKKEYLTYDEVLTDMKVKISWHIDFIQRLKPELVQLMWDIYDDQKINEMASKIKKGKARVFKQDNKELLELYKQKDKSLWEDVLDTTYIDQSFAIDTDVLEKDRKNAWWKETIYDVLDRCGDYNTKEMLLYKDIYNSKKEKIWSVYQDISSWKQMFSREAVEALGLVKDLPSKEYIMYWRDLIPSDKEFIQRILKGKAEEKDMFVWSISSTYTRIRNNNIRMFLSDGSTMIIYRFPENEWKFFEFKEKDDDLIAASVYLKEKKSVEEIESIL